jgi:hypothetical protein
MKLLVYEGGFLRHLHRSSEVGASAKRSTLKADPNTPKGGGAFGGSRMRFVRLVLCLAVLLVIAGKLFAQAGATGTILGTVTDSSGAIIPGAKVRVTSIATNVSADTVTSSAGDFNVPSLSPGQYKVTVESSGFQKSVTNQITLTVDQKLRVDVSLRPGAATETVEIAAQAVALDTDSAEQSTLLSEQQVSELPLNGRNFMQLLLVSAGAVTVGGEQGTMRQGEGNAVSINGGRPEGNNYTLDGLVNTDQALETPAVILSQDAIQEFKVQSGTYSAESGFSASQVNLVSKSGGNTLHGAFFESFRNNDLDALPFATVTNYQSSTATTNPILQQNQFGLVIDGPVWIPKVYNGRNRTFFMANWEHWTINNGYQFQDQMPNPAILTGDFSNETYIPSPGAAAVPLPAPNTPACVTANAAGKECMPEDPTTGQAFPGNMVPQGDITARLAQVAIANHLWSTPTRTGQPEGIDNFIMNTSTPLRTNQQTYRGDQSLGKLGSAFFRYTYGTYSNGGYPSSQTPIISLLSQFETQKVWEVSHTISWGKANVNNFRFGHLDAQAPEGAPAPPDSVVSALGETGVFTHFTALQESWPSIVLGAGYPQVGGPQNAYTGSDNPSWEFADSFSTVHGRHTIGLGIDYRRWQLIRNLDDDFFGDFSFGSNTINNNNVGGSCAAATGSAYCGTSNSVSDMMLGYYSTIQLFQPGPLSSPTTAGNTQDHIFSYLGPYAEDDFKVNQKLTLNLGIRWDFRAAAYDAQNHFFWLDTKNPNGGLCYADPTLTHDGVAPGTDNGGPILRYCGSVPHPGSKTPFAPRFGFNYRLDDKTVVRGGYGIFFDSFEGREIDDSADIYPYSVRNTYTPTNNTGPKLTNQLFPSFTTLGPFPAASLGFIAVIESENPRNPYIQDRTFSIERELARNTTLEVNYIGNKGTHLLDRQQISQANSIPAASIAFCQQTDPVTGKYVNANTAPCPTSTRLPYANFTGTYIDSVFEGYSNYNAMNIKFEHRANDLAVTSVFTWAKSLDDKSAAAGIGATGTGYQGFMDNHDPALDYGPSDFNVPYRFVTAYVYQLPFGRGKRFAGNINRAADVAVGGWELTGIATFQTGFPYTITASDVNGYLGTVDQRANYVSGCNPHANLTEKFQRLNTACFTQPAPGVYGNVGRNTLTQPGINNFDMGFDKNVSLGEHARFQLSVQTFNTFNHHQYAVNVGGLATGGSGGGSAIDGGIHDANFGLINGTVSSPRILQLSGKITF